MHVDAIQYLICPGSHGSAALVASAWEQKDRRIVRGALGCPACGAEYSISEGVADFRDATPQPGGEPSVGLNTAPAEPPNEGAAIRLAAQLDLTQPGRRVLLFGDYASLAPPLSVMFDAQCFAVGVGSGLEGQLAGLASVMRIGASLPFAHASLHGVAMDDQHVALMGLTQVCAILRPHGRLVAPAGASVAHGLTELARDEREWVAARTSDTGDVLTLKRAPR
jgi:uncharacterized protein YbaR (Trm112 family)